jgi:hypothetical protein
MSAFLESGSVSIVAASSVVTVTGSIDCGQVVTGTAVVIDGILVEGVSGTAPDGSGVSSLTLAKPWDFADKTAVRMIAFNTFEGMVEAIRRAREAAQSSSDALFAFDAVLSGTTETVDIDLNGVIVTVTPYGYLAAQSEALIAGLESATGSLVDLEADIVALTADVAGQQGIVDANLATSTAAATTATTQAGIATTKAAEADTDAATASAAATAATGAASTATTDAATATTQAGLASDSAELAEAWAITPENTNVPGTTDYSALHWAAKAEFWSGIASGAAAGAWVYSGQYNASSDTFPPSPSSGQVYEISTGGDLSGFENISGTIAVIAGDRIAKTATGWIYEFGGAELRGNGILTTSRGGTGRNDGKAPELITARNFSISGKATAANVSFTGAGNVELDVTEISATIAEVAGLQAALDDIEALAIIGMMR